MPEMTIERALELALRHHLAGELAQAETLYRQVLAAQPDNPDALHLLGALAHQVGRHADAIALMQRSLAIAPNPDCLTHLAEALYALGRVHEAIACCREAIRIGPESIRLYNLLGISLARVGKLDEAQEAFAHALSLNPDCADAQENLGVVLSLQNRLDSAAQALRRALTLSPESPSILNNLGIVLQAQGLAQEAVDCYRAATQKDPSVVGAHSNLLLALHYLADISREQLIEEHKSWSRQHAPACPRDEAMVRERASRDRLRIGFVSPDLRFHSVAFFLEPLLEARDRNAWEVFCYSDVRDPDRMTERLRTLSDHWRDISGLSGEQAAGVIRRDGIDVLFDLAGHTGLNRLLTFAARAAPVQVSWLGYPDTTGLPQMDFRITDAWADPPGDSDPFHTEQLVRLDRCAWCYRPPDDAPDVAPLPASSAQITFGSFNAAAKISDKLLEMWANILHAVPASRLLLKARGLDEQTGRDRIVSALNRHGIDPGRVQARGRAPSLSAHLATYNEVNIALDTFPYHGTTTTCDALWMGVPVVSLAGDRHVSRVGVSLLSSVGLEELIADAPANYVLIARTLATDIPRLTELRRTLRDRLKCSPLLDAGSFAAAMRSAVTRMCQMCQIRMRS